MRTSRTYYEILGLPRGASAAQIKRRYKQLVRQYHPDVARDKQVAHRLFIQITEAYQALSDPVRRRAYDQTLDLESKAAASTAASRSQPPPRAHAPTHPPPSPVSRLIREAQWAFIHRRLHDAAARCKEAIRVDPRNAQAYAILGDIHRAQGKISAAVRYYSYAMEYNPRDRTTEKKLIDLVGRSFSVAPARSTSRPATPRLAVVNVVWWGIAFLMLMLISIYPGEPIGWLSRYIPQVGLWSWNLVILTALASLVIGALLAINGLVGHPDEELVFETTGANWAVVPTGLILLLGSGIFFLGAAAFYMVVGLIQNSLSRSILITFACVAGVTFASALMYRPEAARQVLLFGGNISFLSMLFGWYFGAMLRPLSEG